MRISASEIARLPNVDNARIIRLKRDTINFKEIEPDSLPKSVEPDAMDVSRITEIVKEAPDIREDIVMHLQEKISSGEYSVSGENIAEMMIRRIKADKIR